MDKILCAFAYSILFSKNAWKPLVFSSHTFYLCIILWLLKVECRWCIFNVLPEWLSYHYFSFIYVHRYTMWSFLLKDKSVFQRIEITWAQKLGDTDPLPQKSDRVTMKVAGWGNILNLKQKFPLAESFWYFALTLEKCLHAYRKQKCSKTDRIVSSFLRLEFICNYKEWRCQKVIFP